MYNEFTYKVLTRMILILEYFYWQFIEIPKNLVGGFRNLVWFGFNFFSIEYCFHTLFAPWKKIAWSYGKGFDLGKRVETFFSNLFSRFVGFFMRIFVILFWIVYECIIIVLAILSVICWIVFPLIAITGIYLSFSLI